MPCPNHANSVSGSSTISLPNTFDKNTPWKLYNHLIEGIPEGILVKDYCLGMNWTYVEAECGMGVAFTTSGGGARHYAMDMRGMELREVAELSKSWCFEEASIGIAALNAWYARAELLDPLGAKYDEPVDLPDGTIRKLDAFELYREECVGKKVVVVGHFPHVERIAEYADLTVLERDCRDGLDTPDPGCEYVIPGSDFVFMTGVTLINKTAPRLLDLGKDSRVIMVGPSVVMSPFLFRWGVEDLSGSIVEDPELAKFAVKNGVGKMFGRALRMLSLRNPGLKNPSL